jgi:hypothetical protein
MKRVLTALFLFGVSFSYVEAAVVVYLRGHYDVLHQRLYPDRASGDYFPLITMEQLQAAGPEYAGWLYIELAREGATLLMLAAVALAVAGSFRQWLAAFMVAFGLWDLFFYVFLRVLIGWPGSLLDWDLLFLLPVPWVGPVWAPVLVAAVMIVAGVVVLKCEARGRPLRLGWGHWSAIVGGGVIIVTAFCWDWRNIIAGGEPNSFNWPLFAAGLVLAAGGLAAVAAKPSAAKHKWPTVI